MKLLAPTGGAADLFRAFEHFLKYFAKEWRKRNREHRRHVYMADCPICRAIFRIEEEWRMEALIESQAGGPQFAQYVRDHREEWKRENGDP